MSGGTVFIALISAIVAFLTGYVMGRGSVLEQMARDTLKAEEEREKLSEDVASRSDEQLDRDLNKWMRD